MLCNPEKKPSFQERMIRRSKKDGKSRKTILIPETLFGNFSILRNTEDQILIWNRAESRLVILNRATDAGLRKNKPPCLANA
jgi:hypothetical protein